MRGEGDDALDSVFVLRRRGLRWLLGTSDVNDGWARGDKIRAIPAGLEVWLISSSRL